MCDTNIQVCTIQNFGHNFIAVRVCMFYHWRDVWIIIINIIIIIILFIYFFTDVLLIN